MSPKHILAFRLSSIGDVAMGVPVIITALEQNPDVYIDFATPKFLHGLFPTHARLKLIDFDKKDKHKGLLGVYAFHKTLDTNQYDAFADLHDVLRSKIIRFFFKLSRKKIAALDKGRKEKKELIQQTIYQPLKPTTERYADVFRYLNLKIDLSHQPQDFHSFNIEKKQAIGIAPFAAHQGKMYNINKMFEVVKELDEIVSIKIFASPQELKSIAAWSALPHVEFVKENSFQNELKVIAGLKLMVSMDSANMHLASLVGTPVVSIWGVTHPYAGFLGYGQSEENIIQDNSLKWRPTSIYGNVLGPIENPNGMQNITPTQVIYQIKKVLQA